MTRMSRLQRRKHIGARGTRELRTGCTLVGRNSATILPPPLNDRAALVYVHP